MSERDGRPCEELPSELQESIKEMTKALAEQEDHEDEEAEVVKEEDEEDEDDEQSMLATLHVHLVQT